MGCTRPSSIVPGPSHPPLSKNEIITALKDHPGNYTTLKSWLTAKIAYPDNGNATKKRSFDGALLFRKETDELRFQSFGIFGKLLFDLLYKENDVLVSIPSSGVAYKGSLGQRITPNNLNLFSMLKRTITGLGKDYDFEKCEFDADAYIFSIDDQRLTYLIEINQETLLIDKRVIISDGKISAEVRYKSYENVNDIIFPARIDILLPLQGIEIELHFDSITLNKDLSDNLLSLSLPKNVKKLPLSELPIDFLRD